MKTINFKLLIFFFGLLLLNCGGKEKKEKEGFSYEKTSSSELEVKQNDNIANIVIIGNDAMQFNLKEIKVKAGQKVKLTLRHIGKLDVNVMGHNFVLLKQGTDLVAFGNKAATQKENNYIPKGSDEVLVHTNMIGGGQVTSIEFDAPEAGTYEFLCSFPGHYALMRGKFIVD
ncbi:azurin [Flavobacteriaceae bacterium SZ-1-7]|uniref:azurin n=1 Tax=Tamlana sedimenti TaxID=3134126 RepID=UPI0031251769